MEQASGDSTQFANLLSGACAACPLARDAPQEIAIKIENPKVVLREQVVILRSGKGASEKRLSEGRGMEAALTSKSKVDVGLPTRALELTKAMVELENTPCICITLIADIDVINYDSQMDGSSDRVERAVNNPYAHNKGSRLMFKR